jgi:hypothetical protein
MAPPPLTRAQKAHTAATIETLAHPPARARFPRVPPPDTRPEYRLPGQGELQLWVRCYAPFKTFGGGYGGDNRQESADTRDSARISYVLTFNYAGMTAVSKLAKCDRSHGEGLFPSLMAYTRPLGVQVTHRGTVEAQAAATEQTTLQPMGRPGQGFVLAVQVAAGNPLVGIAADIDVQLSMRMNKVPGSGLWVSGNLTGDAFPNCEVFLRDAAGYSVLLHVFRTSGGEMGPYKYLPGQNFRPMGTFARTLRMNPIGLIDA